METGLLAHRVNTRQHESNGDGRQPLLDRVAPGVILVSVPDLTDDEGQHARGKIEGKQHQENPATPAA